MNVEINGGLDMLFRRKIEKSCAYCAYGARLEDGVILCSKKGLKVQESSCRRFRYDPCKRIPFKAKAMAFSQFNDSDFSLDE